MKFTSIDPSINNVGWCRFDSEQPTKKQWKFGTWRLEGDNREIRLVDLRDRVIDLGQTDHLVIEYPAFFSSERGQIAAHNNYTIDLAHICGFIAGSLQLDHRTYHPITAIEWKGTVRKEITARKFFRVFKRVPSTLSEHAIDAAMLLLYFLQEYGPKVFQASDEDYPESPLLLL